MFNVELHFPKGQVLMVAFSLKQHTWEYHYKKEFKDRKHEVYNIIYKIKLNNKRNCRNEGR